MYVISYDISSDRVRRKIAKELENYGKRVQYSVFECDISKKKYKELYSKLLKLMLKEEEGGIRIYDICASCSKKLVTIGESEIKEDEEVIII